MTIRWGLFNCIFKAIKILLKYQHLNVFRSKLILIVDSPEKKKEKYVSKDC